MRGEESWAKSVARLEVTDVPDGAVNLNVEGRRLASPIQGFGKMWQKTYQVRVPAEDASATQLIAAWKENFREFWPDGNHFYGALTGIAPGDVALLNMTLPGRMKLSTGVMVLYADDESFTLMTPQGHMFAGWITFSAFDAPTDVPTAPACCVAQVQVLMRAQDPLSEIGLAMGGHKAEDLPGTSAGRACLPGGGDRHLEGALPRVLAGRQPLLLPAHGNRTRRGGSAQHDAAGPDEALDRCDGALRG